MKKYLLAIIFLVSYIISFGEDSNIERIFMEEVRNSNEVKKELNIIQSLKIQTLDPIKMQDQYSERAIKLIYDTLFRMKNGKVFPYLVKNYNWEDEKTLFLELKSNILFHNGKELSSNDVKFTFERFYEEGVLRDTFEEIKSIKIIDDKKLLMRLEKEDSLFLKKLTYVSGSIVKKSEKGIVGSGRYYPKVFNNREVTLESHENYFEGKPIIKKVTFIHEISDKKKMTSLFNEGGDVVFDVSQNIFEESKKEGIVPEDISAKKNDLIESLVIRFGNENEEKYTRKNRKLIEKIINRTNLAKEITGSSKNSAKTFFPKELFKANLSKIQENLEEKSLSKDLKESGLNKEINLMILNNMLDIAEELKKEFLNYGLILNILPHNIDSYTMKIKTGNYDVALYNIGYKEEYIFLNIRNILLNNFKNIELYNAIEPFLKIATEEKNKTKRDKIFDKIVQLIYKEMIYIPIMHRELLVVGENKLEQIYSIEKRAEK